MKFKSILTLLLTIGLLAGCMKEALAQTASNPNSFTTAQITALLNSGFIHVGVPVAINGTTFLVTTNGDGTINTAITSGAGSITFTPPQTPGAAIDQAQQWINENNPTNATYYGTNDIEIDLYAIYLQDNGQALIALSAAKYGLIKQVPELAPEAELFQGNQQGKQSTAGADVMVDYRKPIGDVAVIVGAGGGYDNWSGKVMATVKVQVEYRENKHLGQFVGVRYNFEGIKNNSANSIAGLGVQGGVSYSF